MAKHSDQKKKHTPKRASNKNREARRQRCWLRGQRRKAERRQAQTERAQANFRKRRHGLQTPWEIAKEIRYNNRHPE